MAFGEIRGLKKDQQENVENRSIDFLVVGQDSFSLKAFLSLVDKWGADRCLLLSSRTPMLEHSLEENIGTVRGGSNIGVLSEKFPEFIENSPLRYSVFYKDMKFKKFGGRSRSEALLWGEEYFTQKGLRPKIDRFLTGEDWEKLQNLSDRLLVTQVEGISDENEGITVDSTSGLRIHAKKIYWGLGPAVFLKKFNNKAKLSDQLMEFCESTQTPCTLTVRFQLKEPIRDSRTLFIPLSYTHDWGHFIGEFDEAQKNGTFLSFVDAQGTNEEEVTRKIRLLKKNLEKIFPEFKDLLVQESIVLQEDSMCHKVDDLLFDFNAPLAQKVIFISYNAPLEERFLSENNFEYSADSLSHFTRAVVAHHQIFTESP